MKKRIKTLISLFLSVLMIISICVPMAFAGVNVHESKSQIPIIRILGDGEPLRTADGKVICRPLDIFSQLTGGSDEEGDEGDSELLSSVANVLLPFAANGLLLDDWDPYYEALEKGNFRAF